jgi:hypothetical protein
LAKELILRGLNNAEVLAEVKRVFPSGNTTSGCISWYRSQLRKTGKKEGAGEPRSTVTYAWPEWDRPSDEELLRLAKLTTPYIRFLHPDIVSALVDDNEKKAAAWSVRLVERSIDPSLYLWPGSSCAFPGVRRYAGKREISQFNRTKPADTQPEDALALDDNSYPKEVWSFVLSGRKFSNNGPVGYSLAHIADHKKYKDRGPQEFNAAGSATPWRTLFGLFTCVTNTVFIAEGLIRPTDFAFPLRNLIQRKADQLYGGFCNLLPSHLTIRAAAAPAWDVEAFKWEPPVGSMGMVPAYLAHREEKMEQIFSSTSSNRADCG